MRETDVDDLVQESFYRMWKTRAAQRIKSARGLLFTIARHLALDVVRRERKAPTMPVGDLAALPVLDDKPDAAESLSRTDKVRLLAEALAELPARRREVVVLRRLQGLSQKEVAARLEISERTVENQLARGVRRCAEYLRRRGVHSAFSE